MAPAPNSPAGPDFLRACLIECDPVREKRDRRIKQRALLVSIIVQILIVAALVLVPLLSKGENITTRVIVTPTVPYARGGSHPRQETKPRDPVRNQVQCHFCEPARIPTGIVSHDPTPPAQETDNNPDNSELSGIGGSEGGDRGIPFTNSTRGPEPPKDKNDVVQPPVRQIVSEFTQTAMLTHRVQPVYPPLALQLRREGRVELHAIIGLDGSIQSLQVISGDTLFIRSALEAVYEWQYRPTILNGKPIEVDTHVTVIYTITH